MKNFKRITGLVLLVALVMSLAACTNNALVGKWLNSENGIESIFVFNNDGTGSVQNIGAATSFTYTSTDSKIIITINEQKVEYDYKLDGKELTMTLNGNSQKFNKK